MFLRLVLLVAASLIAMSGCKTPKVTTNLSSDMDGSQPSKEQIEAWCQASHVIAANGIGTMNEEPSTPASGSELKLAEGEAGDVGLREPGSATIQSPPSGFKCPKANEQAVAATKVETGEGQKGGLALNELERQRKWIIETSATAIQKIWGAEQWKAVSDLPFPAEICEQQEREVPCTLFHIPREDGRCYNKVRPQAAQSLECSFQCNRCQDHTFLLADMAGYIKQINAWFLTLDKRMGKNAKSATFKAALGAIKAASIYLCKAQGGSDCENAINIPATWRKYRKGVHQISGIGQCAAGSALFVLQMVDYVSRMMGEGEDLGYLNDGAFEGMLKIAATFATLGTTCGDYIPPLKAFLNDPKVKAISLTLQLSAGINEQSVCEATQKACLLQYYSYGASVLQARTGTKEGKPTQYRSCCLCQLDGRNVMSGTSSQVECERNLTWGPSSRRTNCQFLTVEGTSCSLEKAIEQYDSMHRVTGTGTGPNWLQPVSVNGGNVTEAGARIAPPNPPFTAPEYGFMKYDPDDGTITYEAVDGWKYTLEFMSSTQPVTDAQAFDVCYKNGWRVATLRELLQLKGALAAKGPDWHGNYWATEMVSEGAWAKRSDWGPFEPGWRWGVEIPSGKASIFSTTSTRGFSSALNYALCVKRVMHDDPVAACKGDILDSKQTLNPGETLCSAGGRYNATLQSDGNFVVYDLAGGRKAIWNSGTSQSSQVAMQDDCNLVVQPGGAANPWSTGTSRAPTPCFLQMQDDGNLVVYQRDGMTALWSSKFGKAN